MGEKRSRRPRPVAFVRCGGGTPAIEGGACCEHGCVGCGVCVEACRFGAVSIGERGVAVVDREACRGCGLCARSCPQGVIEMVDPDQRITVRCVSPDPGPVARKVCATSCIGCGLCARSCPLGAIRVVDGCARIDHALCISCGMCATRCPRGAIADAFGLFASR
ncbi:4Fe-4S binding protein [Olsenella uli]|uniref:4Fe-4S binding protein n=1 Tax=Olsenella uli TaxID=133926 RepID=UPI00195D81EE|nr:4Fe-4S binding protein [Olsenella uli]MBM6675481.1 4Fe-4S binding protein [Olsenella uli]